MSCYEEEILSVVMACVMAVSCCSGVMAMAGYNDNLQTTTIETNDGVIFEIKDGVEDSFVGGMRRDSYIAVDSSLMIREDHRRFPLERIVTIRTIEFLFQIPVRLHITLH